MKKQIEKRKKVQVTIVQCPTCGRKHNDHPEFGRYCCASCLQTIIRPLIINLTGKPLLD